ncbi:MAG: methylmalonyl Co-A mutase-associated GTPase MeaB [Candidatus Eisenbacteria bacterium]|nr:methylmalonyl Co-A mutase-associated GTPase MeaB [Candidatus Eisenbacteria bacterium]
MAVQQTGGEAQQDAEVRELAERLAGGDLRAVARAISLVEDGTPLGWGLLDRLYPRTGRAQRLGVTGPPGSGKSTLVNALAQTLRERGERVAILAVDPTSPFSGGAILGDRVRMTAATRDPDLFVRSMASRGNLGGVSSATYEASEILEAAGYDRILIETVGVGQSELEIVELADTVALVLVPESGDAVQVMKAGIMEVADLFVINKYDREGGDRLVRELQLAMELSDWRRGGAWAPPICTTVATRGEGVREALDAAERHFAHLRGEHQRLTQVRAQKMQRRLRMLLNRVLLRHAWRDARIEDQLEAALARIAAREISPYRWVQEVLQSWRRQGEEQDG